MHGIHRQRQWDFVGAAQASGIAGDQIAFVALPEGDLLVEEGEGDVEPLAEAVEGSLAAPYRAFAVRRGETTWAVAANAIRVERLARAADELEEVVEGERSTIVRRGRRLVDDLWEIEETPL